jgi:hypothetical protein
MRTHVLGCCYMESRDSIGRRRQPDQNRGLRPLFPRLPTTFASRAVRIAMTRPAWNRLDTLTAERAHETRPRALGEVIETLLAHFDTSSAVLPLVSLQSQALTAADWQAWQIQKERALLPASQIH